MTNSIVQRALAAACLCFGLALAPPQAAAQDAYPTKPVRFVVSFPPGGSADLMARAVAMKLGEKFGQTFVIDNRPGAGGNIGLDIVAKSPADGYTIGLGAAGALAVNVSLYKTMPFDPVKDFAPVTMLAEIPFVLAAHPLVPAKTVAEFVALAKAKPKGVSIGHGGNGTAMHLSSQLINAMAAVEIELVAYKGSAPAASDAMAGHVPAAMLDVTSAVSFIQGGRLTALAVTSSKRVEALPGVPTFAELGLPGYEFGGLVRNRRARRHAARHHREAERRDGRRPQGPGDPGARARGGRHSRPEHAGGLRRHDQERDREMGQGDRRRRHQGRVGAGVALSPQKPYWSECRIVVQSRPEKFARAVPTTGGRLHFCASPLAGEVGDAPRVAG